VADEVVVVRAFTDDQEYRIPPRPGMTLLMCGLGQGLDMPYSCMCGDCHTCKVTVLLGHDHLMEPHIGETQSLGEAELAEGFRLACQTILR
jgi:ring-1,2-phenylacetyl-CoA epoxidase subunit PaaE